MTQLERFKPDVDLTITPDIVVHATQNIDSGSCIWDASLVLASYFANPKRFSSDFWRGKRVLELGAGCGVTGIVMAHLGANVVLTELADELKLLQKNVDQNPIIATSDNSTENGKHVGSVTTKEYFWGSDPSHLEGPFDIVIAADCVYELQLFDMLAKACSDVCSKDTKAYFCIEHRWSDVEGWWWKEVKKAFNVRLIPQSEHGDLHHPKIDIYELRKKVLYTPPSNV